MNIKIRMTGWYAMLLVASICIDSTFGGYEFADPPLVIGAFNIRIFGENKMEKSEVVKALLEILPRFDIVLIQEIRDADGVAFPVLKDLLNEIVPIGREYESVISTRLGGSTSKEQYAFLYRPSLVTLVETYQYEDRDNVFERPPFVARFKSKIGTKNSFHRGLTDQLLEDFAIIGIHTQPSDAEKEINHLTNVYDAIVKKWGLEDILITGDFNADCSYTTGKEWAGVSLRTDKRFDWLLGDDVDTTVSNSNCAYDRFVLAGKMMKAAVIPGSATVFRFDLELGITQDQALEISDHYPIQLELYGKPHTAFQSGLATSESFIVDGLVPVVKDDDSLSAKQKYLKEIAGYYGTKCSESTKFTNTYRDSKYVIAKASKLERTEVFEAVADFEKKCKGTINPNVVVAVKGYIDTGVLLDVPDIYGLVKDVQDKYDVYLRCTLQIPLACAITVSRGISICSTGCD